MISECINTQKQMSRHKYVSQDDRVWLLVGLVVLFVPVRHRLIIKSMIKGGNGGGEEVRKA